MSSKVHFKVYSDGGSFNNGYKNPDLPQFCASGIVMTLNEDVFFSGSKGYEGDFATISYGELNGALLALKLLEQKIETIPGISKPYRVTLISDSQYVIRGASEWLSGWKKRNWCNSSGEIVAQVDLWKEMDRKFISNPDYNIDFVHVKGHTKNNDFDSKMNDMCDKLCTKKLNQMKMERGL